MFLFIIFFVCLGVTCALTILGGWHVYLISTSTTTIEFYTNRREANAMKKEGKVGECSLVLGSFKTKKTNGGGNPGGEARLMSASF